MFYERLIELCDNRNLKITPLVKELNMGTAGIKRWREGSSPTGDTLLKFANYFNVSTDYLLGKTDNPEPNALIIPEELKNARVAFDRGEFEDLTQEEINALATIAKTFKEQRKKE